MSSILNNLLQNVPFGQGYWNRWTIRNRRTIRNRQKIRDQRTIRNRRTIRKRRKIRNRPTIRTTWSHWRLRQKSIGNERQQDGCIVDLTLMDGKKKIMSFEHFILVLQVSWFITKWSKVLLQVVWLFCRFTFRMCVKKTF